MAQSVTTKAVLQIAGLIPSRRGAKSWAQQRPTAEQRGKTPARRSVRS